MLKINLGTTGKIISWVHKLFGWGGALLVPKRLESNLKNLNINQKRYNTIFCGNFACCDSSNFELLYFGEIDHSFFSKMFLAPKNNIVVLKSRCKKCKKMHLIYDNNCDGYDNYKSDQVSKVKTTSLKCKKCLNNDFSIFLKYEYPDVQELYEYKIRDIGNAYTWIWITIRCNCCGFKYSKFIDLETG